MRLGIISDVHLNPAGTGPYSFHNEYGMVDAAERFRVALRLCAQGGVDAVAVVGDLSHFGDDESLEAAVRLAAESGRPVWVVPGNHDCLERDEALAEAIERVGASNVRLATPAGETTRGGVRVAGLPVSGGSGSISYSPEGRPIVENSRPAGRPMVEEWGEEPVLWLTHYSMISTVEKATRAGFKHPGDLQGLEEVARPLLERAAPTVVVHGHAHIRDACAVGAVLQISCAALIEPPFEMTLLDIETDGAWITVRRKSVPVVPSPAVRLPLLSPSEGRWVFEAGAWSSKESAILSDEVAG